MTSPPIDLPAWSAEFLRAASLPVTVENLAAVVAWARAEGGHNANRAAFNPLNTTKAMPGSFTINSHGVRAYPSRAVGIAATVATIRLSYYVKVVDALRRNAGAAAVANAVGSSPWGTSGALMAKIIPSARAQVQASSSTYATVATATSAGGPLAGPRPDTNLPRVDYGPRLERILVNSGKLRTDVVDAVLSAKLSLATAEASQLTLTVDDPGLRIARSRIFHGRPPVDYGPLRLEVAGLEVGPGASGNGGLTVTCRPRGIGALKRQRGPLLTNNQSPSEVAAYWARRVGLKFVGQQSPRRPSVFVAGANGDTKAETVWAAIQRWAQELGFIAYEAAGVLYFGKPTWLMATLPPRGVKWAGAATDPRIITIPQARRSDDSTEGVEVSFTVHPDLAETWLAGCLIALEGIPSFDSWYLLTGIEVDLADPASMAAISAATPVDPEPQPPDTDKASPDGGTGGGTAPAGAAADRWVHPLRGAGRNNHNFGQQRSNPPHVHAGTDIGAATGTPIVAARAGTVTYAGPAGSYGNLVKIGHPGGLETRYAHQSRIAARVGQQVRAGDVIGYVGSTGRSTGPHLHFEVRLNGVAQNPDRYIG